MEHPSLGSKSFSFRKHGTEQMNFKKEFPSLKTSERSFISDMNVSSLIPTGSKTIESSIPFEIQSSESHDSSNFCQISGNFFDRPKQKLLVDSLKADWFTENEKIRAVTGNYSSINDKERNINSPSYALTQDFEAEVTFDSRQLADFLNGETKSEAYQLAITGGNSTIHDEDIEIEGRKKSGIVRYHMNILLNRWGTEDKKFVLEMQDSDSISNIGFENDAKKKLVRKKINLIKKQIQEAKEFVKVFGVWPKKTWMTDDAEVELWEEEEKKWREEEEKGRNITIEELRTAIQEAEEKGSEAEELNRLRMLIKKAKEKDEEEIKKQTLSSLEVFDEEVHKKFGSVTTTKNDESDSMHELRKLEDGYHFINTQISASKLNQLGFPSNVKVCNNAYSHPEMSFCSNSTDDYKRNLRKRNQLNAYLMAKGGSYSKAAEQERRNCFAQKIEMENQVAEDCEAPTKVVLNTVESKIKPLEYNDILFDKEEFFPRYIDGMWNHRTFKRIKKTGRDPEKYVKEMALFVEELLKSNVLIQQLWTQCDQKEVELKERESYIIERKTNFAAVRKELFEDLFSHRDYDMEDLWLKKKLNYEVKTKNRKAASVVFRIDWKKELG
eukprot:MONOS_5848.1-p1 / transcript=MONOS_5848.1 / gene=MONOS_5848 / organism=Monocercomonoides_exilis_PA203 / gene_product=unspecified product / transcript_product=unspecified product / location=Mono_scaffold00175:99410-101616(-) / protein_length=611 / sequence_SO=supercontig / SO=protein_coding / is_pseudo=false